LFYSSDHHYRVLMTLYGVVILGKKSNHYRKQNKIKICDKVTVQKTDKL